MNLHFQTFPLLFKHPDSPDNPAAMTRRAGLDHQHPSAKPTVAMKPMQLYIGNNRVSCHHHCWHSDPARWPSASQWRPSPDVRGQEDLTSIINPISGLNYYATGGKTAVSHNRVSRKLLSLRRILWDKNGFQGSRRRGCQNYSQLQNENSRC